MTKDAKICLKGISAAPRVTLYTKLMSKIISPRTRPTKGDIGGCFSFLGKVVVAFAILSTFSLDESISSQNRSLGMFRNLLPCS